MSDNKRDLEFLYEMGTLRMIPRSWRQMHNANFANLAEHTFRVMWIAMVIAKKEGANLDKVIKMAITHDIAESRTCDPHYLSRMYVKKDEHQATTDMLKDVALEEEFSTLLKEYELRQSLEAKVVKDADNLDVDMELMEQYINGVKLKEEFQPMRNRVSEILFTETAKKMWYEIQLSNPHDWHLNANNRFVNGDWKK